MENLHDGQAWVAYGEELERNGAGGSVRCPVEIYGASGQVPGSPEDLCGRPEGASSKGLWKIYAAGGAGLEGVWQGSSEDLCGRVDGSRTG
uniref:Uncharacterized protein n=1 Tax=Chromera velia CCMP2878 TaxID=1169474 RepID=A0A0G4F558_9ALVE|eukprot:Cvel_15083.t1-p1 / transcript=Cvel_15083.t1 / gene=Cvel_15083 / organism=Chromera_velia_CCMP2878 / gene_product=hypothetical protein / transcript_product=hypothetical protein / location=Cvel_scaffold1100:19335-19604(-) / protein_length=90 / sequence_SO=supercontig / SO=protein_coding / is_pseudo=false